jgi:YVTN family beta-propeller protein
MLIMSVIMVASKSVIAQSIETLRPTAPDQLLVGGDPEGIAVNPVTNKIYILNPGNGTVTVFDSKLGTVKTIPVGLGYGDFSCPYCIGLDSRDNKIYVANALSDTVSAIDGNSDTVKKTIQVGKLPTFILVTPYPRISGLAACCKIYVANARSDTVSVIDGNSDTVKTTIQVGKLPTFILSDNETYVAGSDTVSVIDHTEKLNKTIYLPPPSLVFPYSSMYFEPRSSRLMGMYMNNGGIYLLDNDTGNAYHIKLPIVGNGTVQVINWSRALLYGFLYYSLSPNYRFLPGVVQDTLFQNFSKKIYIVNRDNGTVSMIGHTPTYCSDIPFTGFPPNYVMGNFFGHTPCIPIQKHIIVGQHPGPLAINHNTHIIYIGYPESGTVSVIKGFSDKVAVGVIFGVNPPDAGVIKCNGTIYPPNTYIYVDSRTSCTAQNGKGFEFNSWTESPLTNRNSSTPMGSSEHPETITVDRYGIFTANFKLPHQLTTEELFTYLTGAISAAVAVNGAILLVPGWRRARNQRTHLEECIKMIDDDVDKSRKNAIEDKIIGYYIDGKLSEDHRRLLKEKISEYYGSVKGSESSA